MAKGDVILFQETLMRMGKGEFTWPSDTLKLGIVDNTITPAADDTTPTWGDYSANEVATTGNYPANGVTLTSVTFAMASGMAKLGAADVSIGMDASGFTDGYWGIVYDDTASDDAAICAVDLGGPESEQAGDVDIEWDSAIICEFIANVLTWETP